MFHHLDLLIGGFFAWLFIQMVLSNIRGELTRIANALELVRVDRIERESEAKAAAPDLPETRISIETHDDFYRGDKHGH